MNFQLKYAVAVSLALGIAGCGGGGGGDAGTTPPVVTVPPIVVPPVVVAPVSDLQTTIPAVTYAVDSDEYLLIKTLNDFRSAVGLGLFAQDTRLDLTAQNGLKYHALNPDVNYSALDAATGIPLFHIEDPARPGFTGVMPLDRAKFAQYPGTYVGESGAYRYGISAPAVIQTLIGGIYHRQGLMIQPPKDVGVAVGTDVLKTVIIETGIRTSSQLNAKDFLGVYPYDKQVSVPLSPSAETPNPYPDVAVADVPLTKGYPISVTAEQSSILLVTTFTVTEAGATTPLPSAVITKANDPNKSVDANFVFLTPNSILKLNTTYNVSFVGTRDGVAVSKSWSFTTKS